MEHISQYTCNECSKSVTVGNKLGADLPYKLSVKGIGLCRACFDLTHPDKEIEGCPAIDGKCASPSRSQSSIVFRGQ